MRRPINPNTGRPIANFFCGHKCKALWQKRAKPVSELWLRHRYLVDGISANEIAREVGRDPKSVWNWLVDFGIERRPRGSDYGQYFQAGAVSAFKGQRHTDATKSLIREARMRDGGVPYLKNGVHHLKGKRGADTPNWRGGVTPERQGFYSTDAWRDACKIVWRRADAKCERCGLDHRSIDRATKAFHVHHVVSFRVAALRADAKNLRLLCDTCHRWVHSRKNTEKLFIGEYK